MIDYLTSESEKDFIYHYTKASTAIEKIVYNMSLKFSPLKDLNDPREYKDFSFSTMTKIGSDIPSIYNHIEVNKKVNEFIKTKFMIGCFCKSKYPTNPQIPVDYGYCRARMWSQYAEKHSGICLVFSRKSIENNIKRQMGVEKIIHTNVEYVKDSYIDDNILSIDVNQYVLNEEEYLFNYVKKHSRDFFFTKQADYRDENEYRIVFYLSNFGSIFVDIKDSLKGIILGDNFNRIYLRIIEEYVKDNNLFCYRDTWKNGDSYIERVVF